MIDGAVIHVQGITGSSGSGIAPAAGTHHPSRAGNLKTYKPLDHQHVPEIVQTLGDAGAKNVEIRFVPVSAPLTRGIFATCFIEVPAEIDATKLASLFDERYAREPFVRRPHKRLPEVVAVAGSNYAEVGFAVGAVVNGKRTLTLFSALDNLIKGGAGQAIQNMNIILGVDEKASLEDVGNWP
jgi:N-acetyl-gamma-glutamyl-phosphate reductase